VTAKLNVVCLGGGPSGLLLGILLHQAGTATVTVHERNAADDTFGFGVVFSDETLSNLRSADPELFSRIEGEFAYWPIMDVVHRGRTLRSGGHGFAALSRKRLLNLLYERAAEVGVDVRYRSEVRSLADVPAADLIVGCDGVNSMVRAELASQFQPRLERGESKYAWYGTTKRFDQFTFLFAETEWGLFQAHVYPFSADQSTFIVETNQRAWRNAGLDATASQAFAPGQSDPVALSFCEAIFAEALDGHPLIGNNSRWLDFTIVHNGRWSAIDNGREVVLLGDAAHTAHFSVGSGTKMAFEDSIALADAMVAGNGSVSSSLAAYEAGRRPPVESTQRAAITSQRWFEHAERYIDLPSEQFAFQLLTRSQRITYDNLFIRDEAFAKEILGWFHRSRPDALRPADETTPPMFYPFQLRSLRLPNRVVVSPMAQYCAVDGMPDDWHLVHLGSRAVGGAGLVMTEMTCVSAQGRITPGCTGIWNDEQALAWRRITAFVHDHAGGKIGLQIGHSGRKGSTRVAWEGMDLPLAAGNWDLLAPSPIPYLPGSVVPREMTAADIAAVTAEFRRSAHYAVAAGFDLLELHFAHGYLLSSFLSPITNHRRDHYGGSLSNRMRFPLEVVDEVRAVWPDHLPLSVRVSATDWVDGGFTGDDAVALAVALGERGCDIIDVSTGQVDRAEQPEFGRLYQTPFADRIRHEAGIATMAVGAISSVDDVNTVILAGRADLCLLARPHLVDPYWTLNAAIDQGYADHPWPQQYLAGRTARRREQQSVALFNRDRR
jgi:anthraniloyl-CoA monooxygenase